MNKIIPIVSIFYVLYGIAMLGVTGFFVFLTHKQALSDPEFLLLSEEGLGLLFLSLVGLIVSLFAFLLSYLVLIRKHYTLTMILTCALLLGFPVGTLLGLVLLGLLQVKDVKDQFLNQKAVV